MFRILIAVFCFFSCFCKASEYEVSLLGLESIPNVHCHPYSMNDKGQIIGMYREDNCQGSKIFLFDPNEGLTLIEVKDKPQVLIPIKVNNNGQILGHSDPSMGTETLFIWDKILGFHYLNIFNFSFDIKTSDFNDLGQVIGTYLPRGSAQPHPCLWDNGIITDLGIGSEFVQHIENLGFHVSDIKITSINNNGHLVGYFRYGKYNEKKKQYVDIGYKIFFWDKDMHILPIESRYAFRNVKINNIGSILISDGCTTYLCDIQNNIKTFQNFMGLKLNDKNTILGERIVSNNYETEIQLYRNEVFNSLSELLGVVDVKNIAPPYSDTYELESISFVYEINNNEQILGSGVIWGDYCPCLLKSKSACRNAM